MKRTWQQPTVAPERKWFETSPMLWLIAVVGTTFVVWAFAVDEGGALIIPAVLALVLVVYGASKLGMDHGLLPALSAVVCTGLLAGAVYLSVQGDERRTSRCTNAANPAERPECWTTASEQAYVGLYAATFVLLCAAPRAQRPLASGAGPARRLTMNPPGSR